MLDKWLDDLYQARMVNWETHLANRERIKQAPKHSRQLSKLLRMQSKVEDPDAYYNRYRRRMERYGTVLGGSNIGTGESETSKDSH